MGFAGCNLCAALLIYFFLIESNGKSLEEIDTMYLMHVPPRKSTGWNLPEDIVAANAAAREQGQRDRGLRERIIISRMEGRRMRLKMLGMEVRDSLKEIEHNLS